MSFFLIPLGIFLISLVLIAWLVARKFVYLKKLAPGVIDSSDVAQEGFWAEFFPEMAKHLRAAKLQGYGAAILAEFEKFLRRLRLVSLRVDTFMSQLVHRVRKSSVRIEETLNEGRETEAGVEEKISRPSRVSSAKKDLKEEEQRLIIEIAKSPKDPALYKKLGQIYLKTGENGDALESFKKALEFNPDDAEAKAKLEKLAAKIENKG